MDYNRMTITTTHTFLQEYRQSRANVTGGAVAKKYKNTTS